MEKDNLILVTGTEGLVGSRFLEISKNKNSLHSPKLVEFDITNNSEVEAIIASYKFTTVINFAAFTDVGEAEKERGDRNGNCWRINVEGVRNLSEAVKKQNGKVQFIQISTDMVFSGESLDKGPYKENHLPDKSESNLTWYGYTKGQGENIVREILGDEASIVRIIYPVRAKFEGKTDYLRKALSLYDQGKLYPLFGDQFISISYIDEIVKALDIILKQRLYGCFHVGSRDTTTPFTLVSYLLEKTRGVKNKVKSCRLAEFLETQEMPSYRYPKYGGLKVEETEKNLNMKFSSWKEIVDKLVKQGLGS